MRTGQLKEDMKRELTAAWPAQRERTHPALLFFRNFFKHPKMLGSLMPSSPALIDRVLRPVQWDDARLIIEYGPGVGSFTTEIRAACRAEPRSSPSR